MPGLRCKENNNQRFNNKTLNACMDGPSYPTYFDSYDVNGTSIYYNRTRTLFNLYSYPDYLAYSYQPPTLTLIDCDFKYFLNDYTSLIQVEPYTMQKTTYLWNYSDPFSPA